MAVYRLKQFIWAVTSSFKSIDKPIIEKYLNNDEVQLFKRLRISEQQHSIRVCKEALIKSHNLNIDKNKLAKIALLHDIGKISGNLNVIDKSIIVILDKITNGNIKKYTYNRKVKNYYEHPKESLRLLKNINRYDYEFLEAIEKHHYRYKSNNKYLNIIKECDDNN